MSERRLILDDFPIRAEYPTHWGDVDRAQHVNNLIYLRWAETARVVFFHAVGIDTSFSARGAVGPILAWQDCKYTFPMVHPDTALVGVRPLEIMEDHFMMQTAIFSDGEGRLAAVTKQLIVPYDYGKLAKAEMPGRWRRGLGELGG